MKKNLIYILILVALAIFYWFRYRVPPNIAFAKTVVTTIDGQQIEMQSQISGPTVIHFYAKWCGPCMAEMRELAQVFNTSDVNKMNFIFLTDDPLDAIEKIKLTMPEQIKFYQVKSLNELGVRTIPTTYFINSSGKVVKEHIDPFDWANPELVKEIITLTK